MGPPVGLEVRGLGVGLAAPAVLAGVDDHLPPPQPPPASLLERHEARRRLLRAKRVEAGGRGREALRRREPKVDIEIEILMSGRGIAGIEVLGVGVRGVHGRVGVARNLVMWLTQGAGVIAQVLVGGQRGGSVGRGVIGPRLRVGRVARVAELAKILVVVLPVGGGAGAGAQELLPGQQPGVLQRLVPGVTEGGLGVAQARALLPLDGLVLAGGEAQARVVMVIAVVSSVIVRGLCSRVMRPGEDGGH